MSHLVKINYNEKGPEKSWLMFTITVNGEGISIFYELSKTSKIIMGKNLFSIRKKVRNTGVSTETLTPVWSHIWNDSRTGMEFTPNKNFRTINVFGYLQSIGVNKTTERTDLYFFSPYLRTASPYPGIYW